MIKPGKLKKGDKVAIVSLSSGMLGERQFIHKYYLGKKRLEEEFGLEVVAMPNALKGSKFLYENPQARADDLMQAFKDKSIKAIITAIGGDDTIRLLPYIDYDVIKNNPKIFMGFSDTTINHLMCYKAGLVSFYGPSLMANISEYGQMYDYEKQAIEQVLFNNNSTYEIKSSPMWTDDFVFWDEKNINVTKKMKPELIGYEVLQGSGKARGKLLGGCLELAPMLFGSEIWPSKEEWKDKILFIDTSEEEPSCEQLTWILRGLVAQGIVDVINGIIVGKPHGGKFYQEYKEVYKKVIAGEAKRPDLPIIYNVNFGHSIPINIIPYGIECELDCDKKTITIIENMTI